MSTNVLFLEHCIDHTVGGSHYCLLEICRQLNGTDYRCIVVFYQENDLVSEFKEAGADVVSMAPPGAWRNRNSIGRSLLVKVLQGLALRIEMLLFRPFKWARLIRKHKVDILHLNNRFSDDRDFVAAGRMLGKPVVSHVRGLQTHLSAPSIKVGNNLDAIITISNAVRDRIRELGVRNQRIHLIYDGISPDRMAQQTSSTNVRQEHDIPDSAIVIGSVGNVKEWKGQKVLVDAFCQVAKDFDDVYCFVVGAIADDSYYEEILEIASKAGVRNRVVFTGYQKRVGDYLRSFDLFVHCSVEPEPFGIVILEAMSLEIPVIATSIGAPQEIVENGESGVLFDPSQASDLADAIRSVLSDRKRMSEMGRRGRSRFLQKFTSEINATKIMAVYESVLSGPAGRDH